MMQLCQLLLKDLVKMKMGVDQGRSYCAPTVTPSPPSLPPLGAVLPCSSVVGVVPTILQIDSLVHLCDLDEHPACVQNSYSLW